LENFKSSTTWKNAFEGDSHKLHKKALSDALLDVRDKAAVLGSKVREDFPSLTIQ